MEEFKQWLADMKEHFEKAKALEKANVCVSDTTYYEQQAFRNGQIEFLEMCQDWFKPDHMRFSPREAAKEL